MRLKRRDDLQRVCMATLCMCPELVQIMKIVAGDRVVTPKGIAATCRMTRKRAADCCELLLECELLEEIDRGRRGDRYRRHYCASPWLSARVEEGWVLR